MKIMNLSNECKLVKIGHDLIKRTLKLEPVSKCSERR